MEEKRIAGEALGRNEHKGLHGEALGPRVGFGKAEKLLELLKDVSKNQIL